MVPDTVPDPAPLVDTVSANELRLNVAVTVQFEAGILPAYVVVPLPLHPVTEARTEPAEAVTVHE